MKVNDIYPNYSVAPLLEGFFGVGGAFGFNYTSSQIAQARSAFEEDLWPFEMLSVLGILRGTLEHLCYMFNDKPEPTEAQLEAWEKLADIFSPEDEVPLMTQ